MKKQDVFALLDELPDEFDSEALMERLYLKAKLDRAEAAIANGELIDDEDVDKEIER